MSALVQHQNKPQEIQMKILKNPFVIVLVICSAMVLWRMIGFKIDAEKAKIAFPVKVQCRYFEDSIQLYKEKSGSFPIGEDWLKPLLNDEDCRKLLVNTNRNDLWGTPLRYRFVGGRPVVDSAGPDQKFDTGDDVHSF